MRVIDPITDGDGRIINPRRFLNLPPSEWWYVMFEAATASVIDDGHHHPLICDVSRQHPIHAIDCNNFIAYPLTRH